MSPYRVNQAQEKNNKTLSFKLKKLFFKLFWDGMRFFYPLSEFLIFSILVSAILFSLGSLNLLAQLATNPIFHKNDFWDFIFISALITTMIFIMGGLGSYIIIYSMVDLYKHVKTTWQDIDNLND